jgi:hypothetical protein
MKTCPKCGRDLGKTHFYTDDTTYDNLSINCKNCINKYFKQYQKKEENSYGEDNNQFKPKR